MSIRSIIRIDWEAKLVYVERATAGKPPRFSGGIGNLDPKICQRVLELLIGMNPPELGNSAAVELRKLRRDFEGVEIKNPLVDRPFLIKNNIQTLFTFTGSRIFRTLRLGLKVLGIEHAAKSDTFALKFDSVLDLKQVLLQVRNLLTVETDRLKAYLLESKNVKTQTKFAR
ncbi:MAG: hypothetical protein ACK5NT_09350 [Pyrinomonadaceae bacterium]